MELVKELNQYFNENLEFISSEQGLDQSDIERFGIYAFAYLDEEENLTTDTSNSIISFSAEFKGDMGDDWDTELFNLDNPDWVETLKDIADQIEEYR